MTRWSYILRKFFGNLWHRPLAVLGSILSLFLLLLLFDLAWVSSLSAYRYYDMQISEIEVEVFLTEDVADTTVPVIADAMAKISGVKKVEFVSRQNARDRLNDIMGVDLLEGLDENPLPRSFVISFEPDYLNTENLSIFIQNLNRMRGVDEIMFPNLWLEKAELSKRLIGDFLVLLGTLILIAVMLNSIHAIILSARTRMEELVQMQLLGAGPVFLAIPFILEGIFYALAAAVAGWIVMYYGMELLTFRDIEIITPSFLEIAYFCLITAAVGMIGGYIGIRRSL